MARGRKPIPRTKEEALQIRKEQIRRNVRAFRDRKKAGEGKDDEDVRNGAVTSYYGRPKLHHNESFHSVIRPPRISALFHLHVDAPSSAVPYPSATASPTKDDAFDAILPPRLTDELPRDRHLSSSALQAEAGTNSEANHVGAGFQFASKNGCNLTWHKPIVTEKGTRPAPGILLASSRVSSRLPREVDSAVLTRRQFLANTSTLFVPPDQGELHGVVNLGPHWAKSVVFMGVPSDIVEQSLHPLCLLQIAHLKQDRNLLSASRYYYGQALRALRMCCRSANVVWRQLFMCAMILGTYELFNGTGDCCVGWQCHVDGASSYLRRFARFDESMTDISYFYYLEAVCIFNPLRERKSSRWSMSTWWRRSIDKYAGETYGSLLRLITPLPAYLEHFDHLANLPSDTDTPNRKTVLLDHGFLLERQLKTWFKNTAKDFPSLSYEETAESFVHLDIPTPAPSDVQYFFPNLWVARLYLLYWASMILLLEAMTALVIDLSDDLASKQNLPFPTCDPGNSALEDMIIQAKMLATDIRRSTSFCLRPCHGLLGKSIVLLPFWVAQTHLCQNNAEQGRWYTTVLRRIGQDQYDGGHPLGAVDYQD